MNRQQRRAAERRLRREEYGRTPSAPSPFRELPAVETADKIAAVERFDGYAGLRNGLRKIASDINEWAGIPIPIDGLPLVVESRYFRAKELQKIWSESKKTDETWDRTVIRNTFSVTNRGLTVVIYETDGKIEWGWLPSFHGLSHALSTLGASDAWGLEQESNALKTLAELVQHRQFKQYLLTGSFLETSRRSGLTYMFRKLRPTVVLDARTGRSKYNVGDLESQQRTKDDSTILCTLCMHPIAYYEGSWAGAMCPTDDVIAALMLMRADEQMLWRRSNQHSPASPQSGL